MDTFTDSYGDKHEVTAGITRDTGERAQLRAVLVTLAVLDEDTDGWRSLFEGITVEGKDDLIKAFPAVVVATALGAYGSRSAVAFRLRQLEAELRGSDGTQA